MIMRYHRLLCAALAVAAISVFISCDPVTPVPPVKDIEEQKDPDKDKDKDPAKDKDLSQGKEYEAYGYIKYSDGSPAAGVSVSDGFKVAVTAEDGSFYLETRGDSYYIFFSYPENVKITTNTDGNPAFYRRYDKSKKRYDFVFQKQDVEQEFALFAMADPQAHYVPRSPQNIADTDRFRRETVPALNKDISEQGVPCYAVTLGDVVYSEGSRDSEMAMSVMRTNFKMVRMPVFQTMGNHDYTFFHSSKPLATDKESSNLYLRAQRKFESVFGPVNYSFNRGNVHIVCMRNITFLSDTNAGSYEGSFSDEQFNWLKADLANVPKTKMVILCVHIPLAGILESKNVKGVIELLRQYPKSTVFSGHTHYKRGVENLNSSGMFEHIHSAVCGQWWWSNMEGDGCPNGYTIYRIGSDGIKDEYFIGVNEGMNTRDYQIRVYRGNLKTGGSKAYFQWPHSRNRLLINVFNADSRWKVEVYEDGKLGGTAQPMPNSRKNFDSVSAGQTYSIPASSSQDWWAIGYHIGVVGRGLSGTSYYTTNYHMYTYDLKSSGASVKVVATDPYGTQYSCTEIVEDGLEYPEYVKIK